MDVAHSDASGGKEICAINSVNSLNNSNWDFSGLIWNGSVSSNFNTASNWTPAIAPASTNFVLIDGNYSNAPVISSATVKRLTMGPSKTSILTVNTNLTVVEDVVILSHGTLKHADNSTAETYKLNVSVGDDMVIASGGSINVNTDLLHFQKLQC